MQQYSNTKWYENGVCVYYSSLGEFFIETKQAGIGTLLVRVHGIRDAFRIEAHPVSVDKPRLLAAHYNPQMSGEYTIFVRWSGVHVPGSPFTVLIREGPSPQLTPPHTHTHHTHTHTHTHTQTIHAHCYNVRMVYNVS